MLQEARSFKNVSTSQTFVLTIGGAYAVDVKATWNSTGTVKLQKLAADDSTYLDLKAAFDNAGTEQDDVVSTFSADGNKTFVLAPGAYQFTIATATAVYATISRCPMA